MARTRKPVVEVRRSQRRRRTVSAYRDGERVVVLIPDRFSRAEETEWVERMLARLVAREERIQRTDDELLTRGAQCRDAEPVVHARIADAFGANGTRTSWPSKLPVW